LSLEVFVVTRQQLLKERDRLVEKFGLAQDRRELMEGVSDELHRAIGEIETEIDELTEDDDVPVGDRGFGS
jgi:hypothetical protein